jgi:hypothetical protein
MALVGHRRTASPRRSRSVGHRGETGSRSRKRERTPVTVYSCERLLPLSHLCVTPPPNPFLSPSLSCGESSGDLTRTPTHERTHARTHARDQAFQPREDARGKIQVRQRLSLQLAFPAVEVFGAPLDLTPSVGWGNGRSRGSGPSAALGTCPGALRGSARSLSAGISCGRSCRSRAHHENAARGRSRRRSAERT